MKHLKRFNENITSDDKSERFQSMADLVEAFHKGKITPPTEQIPINQVYKGIVIKTVNKVDTTGLGGRNRKTFRGYGSYKTYTIQSFCTRV